MTHTSVLNLILNCGKSLERDLTSQIIRSKDLVSEGRYLVSVFDVPITWTSRIAVEGLVVANTLGTVENRSNEWEFYGNGAIRCYKSKSLKLTKTYQWNIIRRIGEKPYVRRKMLSASTIKKNSLPVSDKVFTRDVANNVWHLKNEDFQERLIARFSTLLSWHDEEFIIISGDRSRVIDGRTKLILNEDLVGVPTKIPYFWNSGDVLF